MSAAIGVRRTWLVITAILLLEFGCALALEKEVFPYSTVAASCAPWDGPATELRFSTSPLKCGQGDIVELTISFWRDLPLHDGQTFSLDSKSNWGGASYCKGGKLPCERATFGNIHIESFTEGKSAKGTYDLVFPKLGHVSGSFHADWCKVSLRCG
jgi:hypothetical protein